MGIVILRSSGREALGLDTEWNPLGTGDAYLAHSVGLMVCDRNPMSKWPSKAGQHATGAAGPSVSTH